MTETTQNLTQDQSLYRPRVAEGISTAVEVLSQEPDKMLNDSEKIEFYSFERDLVKGICYAPDGTTAAESFEDIFTRKVNSHTFYSDYFLDEKGFSQFETVFAAFPDELSRIKSVDNAQERLGLIKGFLARLDYTHPSISDDNSTLVDGLAGESKVYVTDKFVEDFSKSDLADTSEIQVPDRFSIIKNPDELIIKIAKLKTLKKAFKSRAADIDKTSNLGEAKLFALNTCVKRVNELLADQYGDLSTLSAQSVLAADYDGQPYFQDELTLALELTPASYRTVFADNDSQVTARLDKFARGAGLELVDGYQGQVTKTATELVAELAERARLEKDETETMEKGMYPKEVADIKGVTNEDTVDLTRIWLAGQNLLSEHDDYNPDQKSPAADNKWRIYRSPKKTWSVDSKVRVVNVPQGNKAKRQLRSLTVVMHEFAHVIQGQNREKVGLALSEKVGTSVNSTVGAEAGAINFESEALSRLFGIERETAYQYARAMQAKLNGGSFNDCVKAFYDSYIEQNPASDLRIAAERSYDRTLRLFNGDYLANDSKHLANSKDLTYLEQSLLVGELEKRAEENPQLRKLLFVGGVDMNTLAQMHRFGLFDLDSIDMPAHPLDQPEFTSKVTEIIERSVLESKQAA